MQFLDRTGVGTLWSMCKTKFALAGHTHNSLAAVGNEQINATAYGSGLHLSHIIVVVGLLLMEIFQNIRPQILEEANLLWNGLVARQKVMALTVMLEGFITEAKRLYKWMD